jgi:hypothetical protein
MSNVTVFRTGGGGASEYARYFWGHPTGQGIEATRTFAGTYVFLAPIDIPYTITIDRLIWWAGATAAGNGRIGIYAAGATDTPAGGALQVESASIALAGTLRMEMWTVADTQLSKGQYYIGIQCDNAASVWWCTRDENKYLAYYFSQAYGAFTDPCPAVTAYNYIPSVGARVKSIP